MNVIFSKKKGQKKEIKAKQIYMQYETNLTINVNIFQIMTI